MRMHDVDEIELPGKSWVPSSSPTSRASMGWAGASRAWMGLTDKEYDAWMRNNSLPKKGGKKQ